MGWVRKLEGPRGIRYKAGFRKPDRSIESKSFERKIDADEWVKTNEVDIIRGTWVDRSVGRKTLRTVYEEMHAARSYAPATVSLHEEAWKHVPEQVRELAVGKIRKSDVDTILAKIRGPVMREKVRLLISSLFNSTDDLALLPNPAARRKSKPTRQEKLEQAGSSSRAKSYLTEAELARLLEAMPERYRALVELMARMGLRPGEAFALKVGKVDALNRRLVIDTAVSGFTKTGEPRELVLPGVVAEMLAEHIAEFSHPTDPKALVFPADFGSMIEPNNFRSRVFNPARDAAGITDKLTPNSCRHTAASFAIGNGATIYAVQKMLGHAKPSITLDVYGELWDGSQERLAEALDAAIRKSRHKVVGDAAVIELAR